MCCGANKIPARPAPAGERKAAAVNGLPVARFGYPAASSGPNPTISSAIACCRRNASRSSRHQSRSSASSG